MKRLLARWVVVASAAGISAWLLARPVGLIAHGVAPDKSSKILCLGLRCSPDKTGCGLAFDGRECDFQGGVPQRKRPCTPPVYASPGGCRARIRGVYDLFRRICAKAITLLDQVVNFRIDLFHLDGDYNLQFFDCFN